MSQSLTPFDHIHEVIIMTRLHGLAARGVSRFLLIAVLAGMGTFSNANAASTDRTDEFSLPASPLLSGAQMTQTQQRSAAQKDKTLSETLAYFFPSDNDSTATVIFMLNTDTVDHTVELRGYKHDGTVVYALDVLLPANGMRRLISDSVATAPPPSWAGPEAGNPGGVSPIGINFTDVTYFASVSLPKGVKVDGYVIFNPGTGTVDPRKDQGAIPLRFMTGDFYLQ